MTWRRFCARLTGLSMQSRFVNMLANRANTISDANQAADAIRSALR